MNKTTANKKNKFELLAPAGNMKALHAAVRGGADAVYLGASNFNARRGADNFNLDNLKDAIDYAHLRGVKVYLTLNIIIFNNEFSQVSKLALSAAKFGIDAFIVQDIGLFVYLKTHVINKYKNVRLHVSTQMNVHNISGVEFCVNLGAKRITLSRELSIDEISDICEFAHKYNVEIEVFGHGALCVSYSGQCLMSSIIGGRSANRGRCAQACRLPYSLSSDKNKKNNKNKNSEFLLSTKDLCSIDILNKMQGAKIDSLKIEGRMKSAEYVYSVVSEYRRFIDMLYCNNWESISNKDFDEAKDILSSSFSRGFSHAYLEHIRGNEMMSYNRPNNRGTLIGRVANIDKSMNFIQITINKNINLGDVIEVWTNKGRSSINLSNSKDFNIENNILLVKNNKMLNLRNIRVHDRVFRVRSASSEFVDDAILPKVKVSGRIDLLLNKPLDFNVWLSDLCVLSRLSKLKTKTNKSFEVKVTEDVVEAARTKAITKSEVEAHIKRCKNTPFIFDKLEVNLDNNVGISYSTLHKIRAKALDNLSLKIINFMR